MTDLVSEVPPSLPKAKTRHGCLSLYLAGLLIVNPIEIIRRARLIPHLGAPSTNMTSWTLALLITLLVLNIVFAVALLEWKRWGAFGLVANALAFFVLNVIRGGSPIFAGVVALIVLLVLYVALNVGKDRRAWPQLE